MATIAKSLQIVDFEGLDAPLLEESGLIELGMLDAVMCEPGDGELAKTQTEAAPVTPPLPPPTDSIVASETNKVTMIHGMMDDVAPLDLEASFDAIGTQTLSSEDGSRAISTLISSSSGSSSSVGVAAKSLMAKSVAQLVGWRALPKLNEAHAKDLMDEAPEADSLVKAIGKETARSKSPASFRLIGIEGCRSGHVERGPVRRAGGWKGRRGDGRGRLERL